MDENLKNQLSEQFKNLPSELQRAISSVDLPKKLQQITANSKLLLDKADGVQTETYLVLFGLEPVDDYVGNLVKNVGLDKNTALRIAHDADELIFKNVRENLKEISQQIAREQSTEIAEKQNIPEKENVLAGIENPSTIKNMEGSISVSAMPSNKTEQEPAYIPFNKGIEIRREMTPEIEPEILPSIKTEETIKEMFHENISPVTNIVESKMTTNIAVPKQQIVIEEKNKLPETKNERLSSDPYREPII